MSEQFVSLLVMFISGLFVGASIDLFRFTIEQLSPKNTIRKINALFELLLWLVLSVSTFYLLYLVKGGEWRVVDPLAQLFGIYAYEPVFQTFFRLMAKILYVVILRPLYWIGHFFVQAVRTCIKLLVKIIMLFVPMKRKK